MTGASIETTLELWASSLREVKSRMRPLFAQERAALDAGLFVDGLLGDERRWLAQRLARKRIQPADIIAWSLAAGPSGRSTEIPSQTKITTVMLGMAADLHSVPRISGYVF
jgi:hypothetical protein